MVDDPKFLSPRDFLTEVITQRLPNKCLPDSPQRIATDTSQKVPVRFGETLKNYKKRGMSTQKLVALPLAIAGVALGCPASLGQKLRPILGNARIFGCDLYEAGIGDKVEEYMRQMLEGKGAVRRTLKRALS